MSRPTLIFDFGNVVAFFDYTRACARLGDPIGLTGEQLLGRLRERGFTPLLQRFERGQIDSHEFAASVLNLVQIQLPTDQFIVMWSEIFDLIQPVVTLIRHLHALDYELLLGSNTNEIHADYFKQAYREPLSSFKHLILSHEIGHLKPSREFYAACVAASGRTPSDCVFIDDMAENVQGAADAGLGAIHFRDHDQLVSELKAMGIAV